MAQKIRKINDSSKNLKYSELVLSEEEKAQARENIDAVSKSEVEDTVSEYITEHKSELRGDTPQRGTDYWTSEDISEIQSYIDTQIGGVLNESY